MKPDKAGELFGRSGATEEVAMANDLVGRRLSEAFEHHVDGVEPSADAYSRLARRVADESPTPVHPLFRPLLTGAAVVVALIAVGAALSQIQSPTISAPAAFGGSTPDSGIKLPGAESKPTVVDEASAARSTASTLEPPAAVNRAAGAVRAVELGPVGFGDMDLLVGDEALGKWTGDSRLVGSAPTAEEAVAAFLDAVGRPDAADQAGSPTSLELVRVLPGSNSVDEEDNLIIASAGTDGMVPPDVTPVVEEGAEWLSAIKVSANVSASADIRLELRSVTDARILAETETTSRLQSSSSSGARFTAEIPVVGTERAWLVIEVKAPGAPERFGAIPLAWRAPDPNDYTVFRVGENDPDGGLVVRAEPGESSEQISVIPAGTSGVRRLEAAPALVGSTAWWNIEAGETVGWVASSMLADSTPLSNSTRLSAVDSVVSALNTINLTPTGGLNLSRRVPVRIGTFDQSFETTDPDRVREFLLDLSSAGREPMSSVDINLPADQLETIRHWFGDLDVVAVRSRNEPDREALFFLEPAVGGAEIVGIIDASTAAD